MKKILLVLILVLILVLVIASLSSNAEDLTLGHFLFSKPPDEIPEWERALKTRSPEFERFTYLVIPLNPKEAIYLMTLVDWTNLPIEFQNIPEEIQGLMIPSILLTQAFERGYRIGYVTDSYIILTKSIYKKEQE